MLTTEQILLLVTATGNAVTIFDKISGQIKGLINGRRKEAEAGEERWRHKITATGSAIVVRDKNKNVVQTVTADDLKKLPKKYLEHIQTYEECMERNYQIWKAIYKQKDASPDPRVNALVDQQLVGQVKIMKGELTAIIDFLQKQLGLELDDHYLEVRNLVERLTD